MRNPSPNGCSYMVPAQCIASGGFEDDFSVKKPCHKGWIYMVSPNYVTSNEFEDFYILCEKALAVLIWFQSCLSSDGFEDDYFEEKKPCHNDKA